MARQFALFSTLILSLSLSFFTSSARAEDGAPVVVKVELSPIGSFEATTKHVLGKGEKRGEVYTAKEIKVLISQLSTGMGLRDKHLRETLSGKNKDNKYIIASDIKAEKGTGEANITVNGITKPVKFKFKDNGGGNATANFKLSLKDFDIKGINYQDVGVQDSVDIAATVPYDVATTAAAPKTAAPKMTAAAHKKK